MNEPALQMRRVGGQDSLCTCYYTALVYSFFNYFNGELQRIKCYTCTIFTHTSLYFYYTGVCSVEADLRISAVRSQHSPPRIVQAYGRFLIFDSILLPSRDSGYGNNRLCGAFK